MKEKGQIWIMVALFMLVLVILFSLAADVGKVYLWQKKLEMATDAAALAGGQEYGLKFSSLELQSSAQDQAGAVAIFYAGLNGADTNNVTVSFNDELNDTSPGTDQIAETVQVDATKMVPLMFTKMLGITSKQIWASAATRIGGATGVGGGAAPWGPPDMNYQVGQRYIIKRGQDSKLSCDPRGKDYLDDDDYGGDGPSNRSCLALGDGRGGDWYRDNIIPGPPGLTGILRVGQMVTTEPGNKAGPTGQGTQARLDACPHSPKCGSGGYVPGCPRIIVVPIMDIFDNGRIERPIICFEAFILDDNSLDLNQRGFTKYGVGEAEEMTKVGLGGVTATYIGSYVAPSGTAGGLTGGNLGGVKVVPLIR
ncbi:hypothetical protein KKH56_01170 [bacterium]|nr:hypothetical protein [bacterium]